MKQKFLQRKISNRNLSRYLIIRSRFCQMAISIIDTEARLWLWIASFALRNFSTFVMQINNNCHPGWYLHTLQYISRGHASWVGYMYERCGDAERRWSQITRCRLEQVETSLFFLAKDKSKIKKCALRLVITRCWRKEKEEIKKETN